MMPDSTGSSIRILLVDDNLTNLKVLSESLRGQGWTTLVADDGESALEQVEYASPHLILLDVMMPGMDGFETCRRLKAKVETATIPVIFMTALSDAVDKVKGLELGAVDYITKPFQLEEAIARIKLHLKLAELTHTLEQQVEARTAELSRSLQQLQDAQLQLVQREKMSTLGQLISGIGHEINNPVTFIIGNLPHIHQYMQDLLRLIQLYQDKVPEPDAEIVDWIEEINLDYLREDLAKLIGSMQEGSRRLEDISLSLRTFARSDMSANKSEFQVHEGIDSTLVLLKHRTKPNDRRAAIEIIKDYGDLPPIHCYPGQLNQVFMNLLANAIDAIEECCQGRDPQQNYGADAPSPHRITIRTAVNAAQDAIAIAIIDNGSGMSAEVKSKIFDPTFTTKAVGKGTGLGLPISYQIIVDKHHGRLECKSKPGLGTEFLIVLPM